MADIIDLGARRRGNSTRKPVGTLTCTVDAEPGVVTVSISTPDGGLEFSIPPEAAEQLATRLTAHAILARLRAENGDHHA